MIIKLAGVHKSYPVRSRQGKAVDALKGVDLEAHEGEMLVIMGPSGCGKTTLLNIIGGILAANKGTVSVGGIDLTTATESKKARFRNEKIGFVFQTFNLLPNLTALENVSLPMRFGSDSLPGNKRREAAEWALNKVGLTEKANCYPPELSGGQMQRVAIARAIVLDPKVILADEPTGNLDVSTAREIMLLFKKLASESDKAIVVVTHEDWIEELGSRTLMLAEGRIVDRSEE